MRSIPSKAPWLVEAEAQAFLAAPGPYSNQYHFSYFVISGILLEVCFFAEDFPGGFYSAGGGVDFVLPRIA